MDKQLYQKRLKKAKFFAALTRLIPFIREVGLTGSMATGKITKQSDIDFFIQVKNGRIWTTRFLTTLLVGLTGQKRTKNQVAGQICLNWYATFHGPQKTGRQYIRLADRSNWLGQVKGLILNGWLGDKLEQKLKNYQIKRFKKDPRTYLAGSQVRWSDQELGFHPPK